jgi:hypothetical protein
LYKRAYVFAAHSHNAHSATPWSGGNGNDGGVMESEHGVIVQKKTRRFEVAGFWLTKFLT